MDGSLEAAVSSMRVSDSLSKPVLTLDEKMSSKPKALDLSHHLSKLALQRKTSPLKGIMKYAGVPGMISLSGGTPHASIFPFETVYADVLPFDSFPTLPPTMAQRTTAVSSWMNWLTGGLAKTEIKTEKISIPKWAPSPKDVQLSIALQYGGAQGLIAFQEFLKSFVAEVFQPAYEDVEVLAHTGATDAWSKVVLTFCEQGDAVLCEGWTYPSSMNSYLSYGCFPVPIALDNVGMIPEILEETLANWDEVKRGAKRPHLMYTVPVGQNPTGATMTGERKKAIYDICCKYDVVIVEDDPYYFLQLAKYELPTPAAAAAASTTLNPSSKEWVASLAPSFLKYDTEGRVIRLDTFSKTVAPGSRLGFFTCNPIFAERLLRISETSTQAPCGFGQALITKLVNDHWGMDGFIRWMQGVQATYTMRRDWMCDAFVETFYLESTPAAFGSTCAGLGGFTAYAKPTYSNGFRNEKHALGKGPALLSFVPPSSGMFVWLKIHLENHPSYHSLGFNASETLIEQLWTNLADAKLLLSPGDYFNPFDPTDENTPIENRSGYFRLSFSSASQDDIKKSVAIIDKVLRAFFKA